MLGTNGMQKVAAGSRMPNMALDSTLQSKTSFGTIIPSKPIQDQGINLKINENNPIKKLQPVSTLQDVRNKSVPRISNSLLKRNDSQGSISSLFGNYGFVKLS